MMNRSNFSSKRWPDPVAWVIVLACVGLSAIFDGDRLGPNLLLSGVFLAGLGAGALFLVAVHIATAATRSAHRSAASGNAVAGTWPMGEAGD
jgi:hypothetical protein